MSTLQTQHPDAVPHSPPAHGFHSLLLSEIASQPLVPFRYQGCHHNPIVFPAELSSYAALGPVHTSTSLVQPILPRLEIQEAASGSGLTPGILILVCTGKTKSLFSFTLGFRH